MPLHLGRAYPRPVLGEGLPLLTIPKKRNLMLEVVRKSYKKPYPCPPHFSCLSASLSFIQAVRNLLAAILAGRSSGVSSSMHL